MRKVFLFILFGTFVTFGQGGGSIDETNNSYLPNVTPPSPDSYNFTKYGEIAINEFIGKTALSIPIYKYNSGSLSVDLILNHDGSGVKVDDMSNWTGLNWTLETGGIVTRTVNDLADELAPYRKYIDNLANFNTQFNTQDGSTGATNLSNFLTSETYDSEVDVFNYSIPGYSGSFYLNSDFIPVQTKNNDEIKIIINGNFVTTHEFIIIDPNGVKYYFGGTSGTEGTFIKASPYASAITTFFLTRINHPISGNVYYEYEQTTGRKLRIGKDNSIKFYKNTANPNFEDYGMDANEVLNNCSQDSGVTDINILETNLTILTISNHKFLKRIYSDLNNESIYFNSELNLNNLNFDRKLNSIEVKNNNTLIHKIDFNYFDHYVQGEKQRIFLTKILIDKDLQTQNLSSKKFEEYRFEYNDPNDLPKRGATSQDFFGFYNNKNLNQSLIPNSVPTNDDFPEDNSSAIFTNDSRFGNRLPNFQYATKGILTDVYYPTGGHTHFEYESEPAKKNKYISYSSDFEGLTVPGYNASNEYVDFLPVYRTQTVPITFYLTSPQPDINHFCQASLKITDLTDSNISPIIFTKALSYIPAPSNYNFTFLEGHRYKLEILPFVNQNCDIEANFSVKLFSGYELIDNIGIRIKRVLTYESSGASPEIKRYYYSNPNSLSKTIEDLPFLKIPDYKYGIMVNKLFSNANCETVNTGINNLPALEMQFFYDLYTSNSFNNVFDNGNSNQQYPEVTISYGGDNFENGGIYKIFEHRINASPIYLLPVSTRRYQIETLYFRELENKKDNYNDLSGELLEEFVLAKKSNSLLIKKHTKKQFDITINNETYNLIGKKVFDYSINTSPTNTTLTNFAYGLYSLKTFDKKLVNIIEKEYFDDYPINSLNDTPFKKIITTQNFEYGALRGLPTVITTNTSDSAIVNKTVNTYVNTASTLPSIPSNQTTIYTNLIAQNRVGSPIQVQQFKNTELLSTQRTLFNNFTVNSVSKILPEKIQISKGVQPLEDKAIFYNYDEHFNPVVMGYADASKTRYMFNTEGLVVAKIENYTGTSTTFPLITGNIDNTNCALQTQYPNSYVTVFKYNLITKKLIQTTDSRCQNTFYEYDDLQRLKLIKDHDENIVKEFDQQFKPQN